MIKYEFRPRQLIDVINDVNSGRIIISPYFQRHLVWRTIHKVDFIKTILLGFPFPEIFIAKGDLDIEKLTTVSCVVDGQQRLNSINQFINDKYSVDNKFYSNLTMKEKENFLKSKIGIIELDLNHDDPQIMEIFKRLNRTFYSLSSIEKLSSEYAPSEFMLVAKLLANEIDLQGSHRKSLEFNPNIPVDFIKWAKTQDVHYVNHLLTETPIFTSYEITRQVHLMFTLNIIGTFKFGIFTRNIKSEILDTYSELFEDKDEIVFKLEKIAKKINSLRLRKSSYWFNKANAFSLIVGFYNNFEKIENSKTDLIKKELENFEINIPNEYQLAAKEGVNNKKERNIRNDYIQRIIDKL
ncbi:MAG: DUF262 domain-containing protein [Candidatus Tenebribacter davisii]|jgi:hypothetical protein|nr:DUF262 domain-containing protein [Candidatus Tenebribacter davisii]